MTSYLPPACGKLRGKPVVLGAIAAARGARPAQLALARTLQLGYAVLSPSIRRANPVGKPPVRDPRPGADEMACIAELERNGPEVRPAGIERGARLLRSAGRCRSSGSGSGGGGGGGGG
ncbi:hypothetical protein NAL89_23570, partial [Burkholderia glumae]|nr:hypothetical protein [Burkholderia glumae]